mmetsp:Transcript_4992/g.12250  ORF Transcript_4992/g.12250 Transcript_4992/m.12250 type:complete len:135 (-) Transcript_4992:348-752(-)
MILKSTLDLLCKPSGRNVSIGCRWARFLSLFRSMPEPVTLNSQIGVVRHFVVGWRPIWTPFVGTVLLFVNDENRWKKEITFFSWNGRSSTIGEGNESMNGSHHWQLLAPNFRWRKPVFAATDQLSRKTLWEKDS